ncbi:DUF6361 family protein [Sphingomonas corticis]|uniref:Uncharacterized protein n=1 Tax=Sphingomonas corticis TaxID=2722791 RepID=A0ABX1CQX6_9SPHN|nr:DUF6361 family protein [Sphingomonas corticis]NJR80314.1 hypothetical protein [Sphingomonas corticis]
MRSSEPTIGWFMLSEADRAAANRLLASASSDGTRDELGFAPIHFAFADRFFPGTSVQHAQLRYAFFAAWSYQELLERTAGERFPVDELFEIERRYSCRLIRTVERSDRPLEGSGISGWTKYQAEQRPVVRASTIYWTALRSWGMASRVAGLGEPPTETQLRALWPRLEVREDGDEGKSTTLDIFKGLPPAPPGWRNKTGALGFALRASEAEYLRRLWGRAGAGGTRPLLSRLTEQGVTTESLWSSSVRRAATSSEHHALTLAERAAAVACIARAAHSALIERKRNEDRKLEEHRHSDALPGLIEEHQDKALDLDVPALRKETNIDDALVKFIEAVIAWVREGKPLEAIAATITARERDLKDVRAYLVNEQRRRDWSKGIASPLDYRWPVVREMILRVREAT